jgi:ABC-type transport system involved in cytochrome bd biosynthesis fused ATPase/permease subunit
LPVGSTRGDTAAFFGERSRVFLARVLLQGGDLITLDESFAALDQENLRQCLECVLRRAETVMVVGRALRLTLTRQPLTDPQVKTC